jgi:hypothetical protein
VRFLAKHWLLLLGTTGVLALAWALPIGFAYTAGVLTVAIGIFVLCATVARAIIQAIRNYTIVINIDKRKEDHD